MMGWWLWFNTRQRNCASLKPYALAGSRSGDETAEILRPQASLKSSQQHDIPNRESKIDTSARLWQPQQQQRQGDISSTSESDVNQAPTKRLKLSPSSTAPRISHLDGHPKKIMEKVSPPPLVERVREYDLPRCKWPPTSEIFDVYTSHPPHLSHVIPKVNFLGVDDPAYFVVYATDAEIHAALGVAGAPPGLAATAAASAANFKTWIYNRFVSDNRIRIADNLVGGFSREAFQCLSNNEAQAVENASVVGYLGWKHALVAGNFRTGKIYRMTPASGGASGGGKSPQGQRSHTILYFND